MMQAASLPSNVLAFVSSEGALQAYALARQANTPAAYRDASEQLATALRREMRRTARPADVAAPTVAMQTAAEAQPAKRTRKARAMHIGPDLAAPLANVPRTKAMVGDFVAVWADESETLVRGVTYHRDKPETAAAAAFQTADRLRRSRSRNAYWTELAGSQSLDLGTTTTGMMGLTMDSPAWLRLLKVRTLPALASIREAGGGGQLYVAEEGHAFGAGDQAEADALEARIFAPRHPCIEALSDRARASMIEHAKFVFGAVNPFEVEPERGPFTVGEVVSSVREAHGREVIYCEVAATVAIERLRAVMQDAQAAVRLAKAEAKAATDAKDYDAKVAAQGRETVATAEASTARRALDGAESCIKAIRNVGADRFPAKAERQIGGSLRLERGFGVNLPASAVGFLRLVEAG